MFRISREAEDGLVAVGFVLLGIIVLIVGMVFVAMPIAFAVGGFKMLGEGMSEGVSSLIGGGGLGIVLSMFVCPEIIALFAIDFFGPAPWFERTYKDAERYDAIEAKYKKVSKIVWPAFAGLLVFNLSLAGIGIWAACVSNFALAGICFGVLGIVCTIESIVAAIGWGFTM